MRCAQSGSVMRRWKWDAQRRNALNLTLAGMEQQEIARRLGVHRHTVANWSKTPEWLAELRTRFRERSRTRGLRRADTANKIAESLWQRAEQLLASDRIENVAEAKLVLAELREYHAVEREELRAQGCAIQPLPPVSNDSARSTFRGFLQQHNPFSPK